VWFVFFSVLFFFQIGFFFDLFKKDVFFFFFDNLCLLCVLLEGKGIGDDTYRNQGAAFGSV